MTAAGNRRSKRALSISGGVVAPGTLKPNETHPLARLSEPQRMESALEALGALVLKVIAAKQTVVHDSPPALPAEVTEQMF